MLDQKEHPVMILIPGNEVTDREGDKDYSEIGMTNETMVEEIRNKMV